MQEPRGMLANSPELGRLIYLVTDDIGPWQTTLHGEEESALGEAVAKTGFLQAGTSQKEERWS